MKYSELFIVKKCHVNKKFRNIQSLNDDHDIFLLKELLDMRDGLMISNLSYSEINDIINIVCCEN